MIRGCYYVFLTISAIAGASERAVYDTPEWKKEIARGYLPYHQLVGTDFPVDDRAHPQSLIYTAGFFHYNYRWHCSVHKRYVIARVAEWIVRSGFDQNQSSRKSWFQSVNALAHEQGHLDINELYSRWLANIKPEQLPEGEGSTARQAATDLR